MTSSFGEVPKVRILVLGDSGVGKTSMVHQICNGTILTDPRWTVGCQTDVKLFYHRSASKKYFIEFWDVGGSRKYQLTRTLFYTQINGIILMFDLNNRKSYVNLRKWIKEIVHVARTKGIEEKYVYHDTSSGFHVSSLGSLPVIVVGNKSDLQDKKRPRIYNTIKDYGLNLVQLSAKNKFTAEDRNILNDFFRTIIERRFYRSHTDKHTSKVLSRRNQTSSTDNDSYM
ncbi:hypothetical protein AAMO2058_001119400 [Amorphochlora amoebiformis]|uniref:Uncharacterized protein n=1 Tax=Amorphochlora amoebiformis TaxID=1561963 RepID=A0A7S0DPG3_9EUKA|mmetsp:Transcript_4842/g.7385  ORF Transcript_4842/g.7385 Transcript_4842/m.7385 type:complete len:228 (+) Transcript_4842:87-770(+)